MHWMITMLLLMVASLTSTSSAAEKLKLVLNWVPEPEFGGIYSAQQIGAFQKNGLDVEIQTGGAGTPTWQLVATGKAAYAVASADEVVIARSQGADLVGIFATYQICPQAIMVHRARGFKSIRDIFDNGARLAVEPGLSYVAFLKNKFGFDNVKLVAYDGGLQKFLNDKLMAQQCFVFSEPLAAAKAGATPQSFLIAEAGYNPYTAVIITRGDRVKEHPEEVEKMAAALREGWRAYLDDSKPANEVMAKLNTAMDPETFTSTADAQKELIESQETEKSGLGSMTVDRWKELIDQLVELKIVEQDKAPIPNRCFVGTQAK
ncbi:ABC transporter substrate-binding protein [soil metagenome]